MQPSAFVPSPYFTADVKKTFSKEYLAAQHAIGVKVRHYREWTKSDLVALYDSYFGKEVFFYLARLVGEAHREEVARLQGGRYYSFAQDDLNEIAPFGQDWRGFSKMMRAAVYDIKTISKRIPRELAFLLDDEQEEQDSVTPPFAYALEAEPTPMTAEADGFNQQAALASMETRQALKHAAPKSTVRDAVKSFTSSLLRSA